MPFEISSTAFKPNALIPKKHTGEGEDVSPQLRWSSVPAGTKSFALIMDDPDAPPGTWVHWLIYDIPADATGLPEGVEKKEELPDGSKQGACWGVSSYERIGYYGPMPPPGKPHRYFFKLYALDKKLGLPANATKTALVQAMKGRILGQAEVIGLYKR